MFGIGFGELILIFIVSLIILGPKQLTQLATKSLHMYHRLKQYLTKLKNEIYQESGANNVIDTKKQLMDSLNNANIDMTKISERPQITQKD